MEIDWIQLIAAVGGLLTGGAAGLLTKSGRTKAKADTYKSMSEAYECRIAAMEKSLATANDTIAHQRETISKIDADLDDKTYLIRNLNQKIWETEQECNRLNERIFTQSERITRLSLETEHWKHWHCRRCDCRDPRGREPQQDPPEQLYRPYMPPG